MAEFINDADLWHDVINGLQPLSPSYSGDWNAPNAVLAGGDAWYSVVGGLLPKPTLKLFRAAQAGDEVEAAHWDERFRPLWDLLKELSSPRAMSVTADILGLYSTQPPRPILPLPPTAYQRVAAALETLDHGDR